MPGGTHSGTHGASTGSPRGSDADQSGRPKGRRYGFACSPCKQRKVKCSGEQPVCAGCQRKGSECVWPVNAHGTESQLLREANERIRQLEGTLDQQPGARNATHTNTGNPDEPISAADAVPSPASRSAVSPSRAARNKRRLDESLGQSTQDLGRSKRIAKGGPHRPRGGNPVPLQSTESVPSASPHFTRNSHSETNSNSQGQKSYDPRLAQSLWHEVGIGEDGEVVYNGPTSRFHAGTLLSPGSQDDDEDSSDSSSDDEGGETAIGDACISSAELPTNQHPGSFEEASERPLPQTSPRRTSKLMSRREPTQRHLAGLRSHYTLMDSVWTPLIAAKPTMNGTGVDTKTGVALLDIYWTWLHPLHHLVYRPALVMDLALGGPHCSDFLLLCIFALAARHLPSEEPGLELDPMMGEQYAHRAKTLLIEEMAASTPSIPTIQGLLILGGRHCAIGASSEGWLYTGMAFRMMQDVGLHLDTTHLAGVAEKWTPTELEVRKRLYNAAYVWDKTLSLALGRPPTLIRRPYPVSEIFDKYDDGRLWHPVHAKEVVESFLPTPSWVTSTLCVFSSLHEITTDMLLLFSRNLEKKQCSEQVANLDARFCRWYAEIPDGMKISQPSTLSQSPPPHIVSLNLLYHTLHILLRRPFLSETKKGPGPPYATLVEHCISHSKSIHEIHTLYTKTFPHRLMTYQVSYCIYTAATVEALELKSYSLSPDDRSGAAARLTAAVRILQNEASHTPGSGKSLDTIRRLLTEGERPPICGRRHSVRRKRRATNRSQPRNSGLNGGPQYPNQGSQNAGQEGGVTEEGEVSRLASVLGPPTTDTGGSSEFSTQLGDYAGNEHAPAIANPSVTGHPLELDTSLGTYSAQRDPAVSQDFGNAFDINAGGWGLDLGFYAGTDTGAGFHPDAFSFVVAANTELPRMLGPPATPPGTSIYSTHPGWTSRNAWPAPEL